MNFVALLLFFLVTAKLSAEEAKPPMIRIEFRTISPRIPANSFAAKPKTLYIAGTTFSRMEEQPDPPLGIHGLIVCAEPDIWMVNLIPRVARHIVDPGPTYVVHHNILDKDAPKEFSTLAFGKEVQFLSAHAAKSLEPQSLDGQPCEVSEFRHENYRVVLFVRADTHKPFHLDVFRADKPLFAIRYLSYQTDLLFDAALFKPPAGVTIEEAKPPDAIVSKLPRVCP